MGKMTLVKLDIIYIIVYFNFFIQGETMKMLILITAAILSTSLMSSEKNIPTRSGTGYTNPAMEEGYSYDVYPEEKIWTQFGRPYWRSVKKTQATIKTTKTIDKVILKKTQKNVNINLDVRFASSTAIYNKVYTQKLDQLAKAMKLNKEIIVEVRGHSDSTGDKILNLKLSQDRALSVKDYLIKKHGINPKRLSSNGYGSNKPLGDNATEYGKSLNRRVEAIIIKK